MGGSQPRVLVVDRFDPPTDGDAERFLPAGLELVKADARDQAAQLARVGDADCLVVGGVPLGERVIEAGRRLKLIQKLGVGVDKIDLAAAARCGIPVAITPGVNAAAVGEATLMLLLALARRLLAADAGVRAGRWEKLVFAHATHDLAGRTVGIVGLGRTGKQVAKRLAAFDVRTLYYDIVRPGADVESQLQVRFAPLDELLAQSDAVTLHVPLTAITRRMLDAQALARMRPGAYLINTARGEVVDEAALEAALRSGQLAGAGLDVYDGEPLTAARPLFALPNVVLTPHVAGVTRECVTRMWHHAYANCVRAAAGEPLAADDLIGEVSSTAMRNSHT
jgi:phosphoglycerate dehydrogenase-like enzyme